MTERGASSSSGEPDAAGAAALPETEERPRRGSWWLAALPGLVAVAVAGVARLAPALVEEHYARGVYPRIAQFVAAPARLYREAAGRVDLERAQPSLAEVLGAVVLLVAIISLWRALRRGFGAALRRTLVIAGVAYGLFLASWGLNYARSPLAETLDLEVRPVSVEELEATAFELLAGLDVVLASAEGEGREDVTTADVRDAWQLALEREPSLGDDTAPIVAVPLLSSALAASAISGIFSPFTQECHVVAGLPRADRGFVACHEVAHAIGWAREDEANYLAWRVGSQSRSAELRVSAYAMAFVHVAQALARVNREGSERVLGAMSEEVHELLLERQRFWSRTRSRIATGVARKVNDTYLKSQGQVGIASYGRMVDLLVAQWRSGH